MKLAAWMLLLVSTASFATALVLQGIEERQQQARAEMSRPDAAFLRAIDAASASAAIEYE